MARPSAMAASTPAPGLAAVSEPLSGPAHSMPCETASKNRTAASRSAWVGSVVKLKVPSLRSIVAAGWRRSGCGAGDSQLRRSSGACATTMVTADHPRNYVISTLAQLLGGGAGRGR